MNQPENQQQYRDYDEIDLRDIFRILGKWKYKIISVTLICMLLSGLVSWFFLDPVYEAKVVVALASITPLTGPGNYSYIIKDDLDNSSKKISDNIDELVRLSQVDVGKYKQLISSVNVLENTVQKLKLDIKVDKLKKSIQVEEAKEKNGVIEISVQSENPEQAAKIANTLVNEMLIYLGEINNRKMDSLKKTLDSQLASAKNDLDTSFTRLKKYPQEATSEEIAAGKKSIIIQTEIETRRLESEVKRNEDLVNSLSSKILQLEMFKSLNSAENQVIVLSPAVVPEAPVKPNKTLNVAIAAVLGLMLSVFGVFLIEYLKDEQ